MISRCFVLFFLLYSFSNSTLSAWDPSIIEPRVAPEWWPRVNDGVKEEESEDADDEDKDESDDDGASPKN